MNGGLHGLVVAIPARNEAELLPRCLEVIGRQSGLCDLRPAVIVLANNCSDGTAEVVAELAGSLPLVVRCHSVTLPSARATAGWARRLAMELAADIAHEDAILVSTDADTVADPDWLQGHVTAMTDRVSAVAGRVSGDWAELSRLPDHALETGELEWRWQAMAAELEALIDPVDHDPWPRHRQRCGANFAVRRSAWVQAGGIPPIACGEDRAFLQAVERTGGLVRHAPEPHVTASGRLFGRAVGGMSSTLAARAAGEAAVDSDIESTAGLVVRLRARALLRKAHANGSVPAALAHVGIRGVTPCKRSFTELWEEVEQRAPAFRPAAPLPGMLAREVEDLAHALAQSRSVLKYA